MSFRSLFAIAESLDEVHSPSRGPLTQGTIFSGVKALNYDHCTAHGIVITARCDVANDKVNSYSFLPIVSLSDWIQRDGRIILAERMMSSAKGRLRDLLRHSGNSPSVLETESLDRIREILFPVGAKNKKLDGLRKQFDDNAQRFQLAQRALDSTPEERLCNEVVSSMPSLKDVLVKELTTYRLNGYYFLKRLNPGGADSGFVVLLREVGMLPRSVAMAVAEGLDQSQFVELCKNDSSLSGKMLINEDDLAMPIGVLASPNIEHLMQTFSYLFGRIGINDHEPSYVSALWDRQPSAKETE